MSNNKEDTLRQFCDVTGADETRSRFFLESSNWQLEVALSSFYEHGGSLDDAPASQLATPAVPTLSDSDMEYQPESPVRPQKKDKTKRPTNPKFATLETMQQDSSSDEEEGFMTVLFITSVSMLAWLKNKMMGVQELFHDQASYSKHVDNATHGDTDSHYSLLLQRDEEICNLRSEIERLLHENCELRKQLAESTRPDTDVHEGQAFYAGGSERSGQQILGPGKNKKDIVTEMFKSVRERGAVVFEDEPSSTSRGRGGPAFSGMGYRLGQTASDHEPVTAANAQSQEEARSVRLRLYREGFTVDDGVLRQYTDPENAEFLSCIRRGEIPLELSRAGGGGAGQVRVSLEDRRHEPCPRAVSKTAAFTGKGQMLGSPTPATVGAPAVGAPAGAPGGAPAGAARDGSVRDAQLAVRLDEALPVTTIQIRLADGSRVTGRFNHTHTVGDLREFVSRAGGAGAFALLAAFPPAELTDPTLTLAAADLLNATLLQRLK